MWTTHKNHIRILFDSPRAAEPTQSKQSEVGKNKTQESRDDIDTKKLDTLTKELLEGFIKEPSRQKAVNLLSNYLQQKEKELQSNPTLLKSLKEKAEKIKVLSNYDGYLFGSSPDGNQKEIPADRQKSIKDFLQISHVTIDFSRTKKDEKITISNTGDFIKENSIEKYTQEWIRICLDNPQQIKSGGLGKLARNTAKLFGREKAHSLEDELNYLKSLKELPSEYISVIKTLINISNSKEFGKYTGSGDKLVQNITLHAREFNDFQNKFKTFVMLSAKQKKEFSKEDFDKHFDEKRELNESEIKKADEYGKNLFDEVLKSKDIDTLLRQKETELNQDQTNNRAYINRKRVVLNTIKGLAQDGRIRDYWGTLRSDALSVFSNKKTTEDAFIQNAYSAIQSSAKSGIIASVKVENNKYEVENFDKTVQKIKDDIRTINAELVKKYLGSVGKDYTRFEKELGKEAIAAIGNYLKFKSDTELFKGNESSKDYFLKAYNSLIQNQNSLLESKKEALSGSFEKLFQGLMKYPEISKDQVIQKKIKEKDIGGAYDMLAGKISNGRMAEIMSALEKDAKNIESEGSKKLIIESEKWKGKTIKDANIKVNSEEDQKTLEKISKKSISTGSLDEQDISFLLRVLPRGHELRIFIELYNQVQFGGKIAAEANVARIIAKKGKPTDISTVLSKGQNEILRNTSTLRYAASINEINQKLYTKNADPTNAEQKKQFVDNKANNDRIIAISTAALVNNQELSKEDRRAIIRANITKTLSDKQVDKWIDTQVFISRYVEEKNFVDIVEKNAAYLNLGETKSVGELYGMEKIDISNMSSDNGSISLSDTDILGNSSFAGMNELMNCRVEVGDNGVFSRTIRTPDGKIIADNVPLENIDTTIQQLGRFFTLGLGVLAPYMEQVSLSIKKSRPDSVSGLDGSFDIKEDEKFLKILAIMLYGKNSLPTDPNIPNLIRLFNRTEREYNPKFILKERGIIQDSGTVNLTRLDTELRNSSKLVS